MAIALASLAGIGMPTCFGAGLFILYAEIRWLSGLHALAFLLITVSICVPVRRHVGRYWMALVSVTASLVFAHDWIADGGLRVGLTQLLFLAMFVGGAFGGWICLQFLSSYYINLFRRYTSKA